MKEYVLGFLFSADLERVVLVEKSKPAWQRGLLNGVGGAIEPGESPAGSMDREFHEETACPFSFRWTPLLVIDYPEARVYVFATATAGVFDLRGLPGEPVDWYPVKEVKGTIPNLAWMLPMAKLKLSNLTWESGVLWHMKKA